MESIWNKKKLKGSGTSVTERLTPFRMGLLVKACKEFGSRNVGTLDGRITYMDESSHFLGYIFLN